MYPYQSYTCYTIQCLLILSTSIKFLLYYLLEKFWVRNFWSTENRAFLLFQIFPFFHISIFLLESQFFLFITEYFFLSQTTSLSSEHPNLEVKKKSSLIGSLSKGPANYIILLLFYFSFMSWFLTMMSTILRTEVFPSFQS